MGQGHNHEHGHSHSPSNYGRAFAIGVTLNLGFVIAEVIYGRLAHSLALVADAGHNLSDVLGLVLAWGAIMLSRRTPTKERTYGWYCCRNYFSSIIHPSAHLSFFWNSTCETQFISLQMATLRAHNYSLMRQMVLSLSAFLPRHQRDDE
jgi:hypothetical protein